MPTDLSSERLAGGAIPAQGASTPASAAADPLPADTTASPATPDTTAAPAIAFDVDSISIRI